MSKKAGLFFLVIFLFAISGFSQNSLQSILQRKISSLEKKIKKIQKELRKEELGG